jgi:hypothetical protein
MLAFVLAAHDVREGEVKVHLDPTFPFPIFTFFIVSYYGDSSRVVNRQTVVVNSLHVTVRTFEFETYSNM